MKKHLLFLFIPGMLLYASAGKSQQIMIDRGIQAAQLWCFPIFNDSLNYLYLPSRGRLGLDQDSLPEFSFLRYITERPDASGTNTVTEAGGGGIVNFLVLYDTPEKQIRDAEALLQKRLDNPDIRVKGPIVFNKGRYTLVSSVLLPDGQTTDREIIGVGEAPILENSRIAFSFELDPVRSKLLLESFKMKTPDISMVFELGFSGLTDSYQAELTVDWTEVRKSQAFEAGASVYFIGADVKLGFDELFRNNAIKLHTIGNNDKLDGLLNTVYAKLLDLLFKRVEPEKVPSDARGGLFDAIGAMMGPNGPLGSRQTTGFGLNVGYQLKEMKAEGQSNLFFRGRSTVERNHFITFNIGDLYKQHGANQRMFRDIALYDPAFQQRDVYIGVDGSLEKEFDQMVNSVTVTVRKKHRNGEVTMKEVLVNKERFLDSLGRFKVTYLNRGDSDLTEWLSYEYQTIWQFVGGGTHTTAWDTAQAAMINLFAPFQRKTISLEGDLPSLVEQGFRAVSVRIEYPFFNETRKADQTVRPQDNLYEKTFDVTLPLGRDAVNYQITWVKKDGKRLNNKGIDDIGLIFIDELPPNE